MRKRCEGYVNSGLMGIVVKVRLECGPDWEINKAWLAGSRVLSNWVRKLVWMAAAALRCQPRSKGPSMAVCGVGGGDAPLRISSRVGGFQSGPCKASAASSAAWTECGAGWERSCHGINCAVKWGNCWCSMGRVSAQEAQYAAGASTVADGSPRPPSASGRCALPSVVAVKSGCPNS